MKAKYKSKRSRKEIEQDIAWLLHERDTVDFEERRDNATVKERLFVIGGLIVQYRNELRTL